MEKSRPTPLMKLREQAEKRKAAERLDLFGCDWNKWTTANAKLFNVLAVELNQHAPGSPEHKDCSELIALSLQFFNGITHINRFLNEFQACLPDGETGIVDRVADSMGITRQATYKWLRSWIGLKSADFSNAIRKNPKTALAHLVAQSVRTGVPMDIVLSAALDRGISPKRA